VKEKEDQEAEVNIRNKVKVFSSGLRATKKEISWGRFGHEKNKE